MKAKVKDADMGRIKEMVPVRDRVTHKRTDKVMETMEGEKDKDMETELTEGKDILDPGMTRDQDRILDR